MKKNKKLFLLISIVTAMMFVSACGSNSTNTNKEESNSEAGPSSTTIKFGYSPWIGSAGAIVANEKNLFAAKGVDVEFVTIEGNTRDAFMSGKLDAVVQSLDAVVQMKTKENASDPIQVIAVIDRSAGADGIIANKQTEKLEDLKGKSVAVGIGSSAHFLLLKALESVGLQESDVKIQNMDNNLSGSSFMSGQVDSAVTWEPYLSEAVTKGGHMLYSTADEPNLIVDTLVVKQSLIDKYPDEVKAMAEAFDEGLALFNSSDEVKTLVGDTLGMDLNAVKATLGTLEVTTLEQSKTMLVDNRTIWEDQMKMFSDFFLAQKIITAPVEPSAIINDFLFK